MKLDGLSLFITCILECFLTRLVTESMVGSSQQVCVCVCDTELMDEVQVAACNKYSKLTLKETPMLMLEFHGSKNTVEEQAKIAGLCLTVDISLWLL